MGDGGAVAEGVLVPVAEGEGVTEVAIVGVALELGEGDEEAVGDVPRVKLREGGGEPEGVATEAVDEGVNVVEGLLRAVGEGVAGGLGLGEGVGVLEAVGEGVTPNELLDGEGEDVGEPVPVAVGVEVDELDPVTLPVLDPLPAKGRSGERQRVCVRLAC